MTDDGINIVTPVTCFMFAIAMFYVCYCLTSLVSVRKTKRRKAEREQREPGELAVWRQTAEGARVVQLAAHVIAAVDEEAMRRDQFSTLKEESVAIGDNGQSPGLDVDISGLQRPTSSSKSEMQMLILKDVSAAKRGKIVKELLLEVMELELARKGSTGAVVGLHPTFKQPNEPVHYARLWAERDGDEVAQTPDLAKCDFDRHYEAFRNWAWDKEDETKKTY